MSPKHIVYFLLLGFSVFFLNACEENEEPLPEEVPVQAMPTILKNIYFKHDSSSRFYHLYKPRNLAPNAPLVFALHGYTQTNDWAWSNMGMNRLADTYGFAVCYPQGALASNYTSHWNAELDFSVIDDIGFLEELALFLQTEHQLDPKRTFSCGFSNGGFMNYTMACQSTVFRAIASVAGTMSGASWENCDPKVPLSVLQIHGEDDFVVPINGNMPPTGGWGGAPALDSIMRFWALQNNITESDTVITPSIERIYYRAPEIESEVWFFKINNYGHRWPTADDPSGLNTSEVIWEFFSKF